MRRLARLLSVVALGGLLQAGLAVGVVEVAGGLARDAASAHADPLPPLGTTAVEGSTVYADDGTTVLAYLHSSVLREPVPLSRMAKVLVEAVLDTEDHNFFVHGAIDLPSTFRALLSDSLSTGGIQGGSTIAQQLVKQVYLGSERTIGRKVKEAVLAGRLERRYSKRQILQDYLNVVYFGNGAYGVEAAASVYFGVPASRLDLPQAALLAGLIQDPVGYDPILEPAAARRRRSEVLERMAYYRDITPAQSAAADAAPLPVRLERPRGNANEVTDYYVRQVENELLGPGSPLGSTYAERYQTLFGGGLKIITDLDPRLQALAEQRVAADTPPNHRGFEEALVSIDPSSGKVLAMVGGTDFAKSSFDAITQGSRQPGSGFKIFTLLAALEQGYSVFDTVDAQSPCAIAFPGNPSADAFLPPNPPAHNDEGTGGGVMTVVDATAQSMNCAFLRIAHEVGLDNIAAMARRLGVSEKLDVVPSMVLGADAVHPIEMAAAYAAVADGGVYHRPSFIDRVVDRTGSTIYKGGGPGKRVLPAQIAEEATIAFQAVVQDGTGTGAALPGRPSAGKTGTTNNGDDAWFNGYTPQLETTVWMGSLSGEVPMTDVDGVSLVYGGTFPAYTWRDYMERALAGFPVAAFMTPDLAALPPPRYITSAALVRDDVLDHNAPPPANHSGAGTSPGAPGPSATAPTGPAPSTTSPTPSTTAPSPSPPAGGTKPGSGAERSSPSAPPASSASGGGG